MTSSASAEITHAIPIRISAPAGTLLPTGQVARVYWVLDTGGVINAIDSFPVIDGVATYRGPPLDGSVNLRWAVVVREPGAQGPLFRSDPLRRLPGAESSPTQPATAIEIFRCIEAVVGLGAGGGVPELVAGRLQALQPPLAFSGVEIEVDVNARVVATVRGRLRVANRNLPFVYRLPMSLGGRNYPAVPARAVEAFPEGSSSRGANLRPHEPVLRAAVVDAVERVLDAQAEAVAREQMEAAPVAFEPTTFSVSLIQPGLAGTEPSVRMAAHAGAVTGGIVGPEPVKSRPTRSRG